MTSLSEQITIKRRYLRSINIERDIDNSDAVSGFVLTSKAVECLKRFAEGFAAERGNRAWTLTGPYGSGKSSLLQFLLALLGANSIEARQIAQEILTSKKQTKGLVAKFAETTGDRGFVRCIVSCRNESVAHAVLRAIKMGTRRFFGEKHAAKEPFSKKIDRLLDVPAEKVDDADILLLLQQVSARADAPVLLVLDELGKCLEHCARKRSTDLFLLQQLAELPSDDSHHPIFVIGLLHQSFADYADMLSQSARNEWSKVQGRFEDIGFTESTQEVLALLSDAVNISHRALKNRTTEYGKHWMAALKRVAPQAIVSEQTLAGTYPLHPLATLLLPQLCARLGQNERSLFTLLTSDEPAAFQQYLRDTSAQDSYLPTYKLHHVYDYLSESGMKSNASRGIGARWVEIEDKIASHSTLDDDEKKVLKTVGLFNLVSVSGALRATAKLVSMALADEPGTEETQQWEMLLSSLAERKIIGYRKHIDEYRIWEGTDFDLDAEIGRYRTTATQDLASVLTKLQPLPAVIPHRHSYETGTLRLFECMYASDESVLSGIKAKKGADGVIVYWLGNETLPTAPARTADDKPLVVLSTDDIAALQSATTELLALRGLFEESVELQVDRVARKEVRNRLLHAQNVWADTFHRCFGFSSSGTNVRIDQRDELVKSGKKFNSILSELCDGVYNEAPTLWNELINRRELSSQGAKARRELVEAMLARSDQSMLGLDGNGPEVSMYKSVLEATGIHAVRNGTYCFGAPSDRTFKPLWAKLEQFVQAQSAVNVSEIYEALQSAPVGLKAGSIPLFLVAFLMAHQEHLSLYRDGTFIGAIGPEHFELLVKDPSRFSVKSLVAYETYEGLFEAYRKVTIRDLNAKESKPTKSGILSVVRPLVNFVRKLPLYSQQCRRLISPEAVKLRQVIAQAVEPDSLLFHEIPVSLGFDDLSNAKKPRLEAFSAALSEHLRELNAANAQLLAHCQSIITGEFGQPSSAIGTIVDRLQTISDAIEKSEFAQLAFQLLRAGDSTEAAEYTRRFAMVIADRPPESWSDADLDAFPTKAKAFIRKLRDFEALHAEMTVSLDGSDFEISRISVVAPDGKQINRLIHVEKAKARQAEKLLAKLSAELDTDAALREAVFAKLAEQLSKGEKVTEQKAERK